MRFAQQTPRWPTGVNILGRVEAVPNGNIYIFGQSNASTPAAQSIFSAIPQQPPLASNTTFGQSTPRPPSNPFQQPPLGHHTNSPTATSDNSSVLGQTLNQPQQYQPPMTVGRGNDFERQSQSSAPMNSLNVYSKMGELKPDELQAFQAQEFDLGSIPNRPPPRELC